MRKDSILNGFKPTISQPVRYSWRFYGWQGRKCVPDCQEYTYFSGILRQVPANLESVKMPTMSSPWYQHRPQVGGSLSPPPPPQPKKLVPLSDEELDAINRRMCRPTEASKARQALFWKMDGFMDRGRCAWTKMAMFKDVKKTMWTNGGTIKKTCSIRPTTVSVSRSTICRLPQSSVMTQYRPYTSTYRY
ncbi:uncharacterized protein LOC124114670 [Haliotis rufescens]|uniref:uncharacterized protein LOC124114670 n=1 Tax=Haliotis rufescens TaxID=6454 RepID=UPI00201EE337|nr:uncharacterized protein LOC124114670 [Haliotis rufescens]